MRTTTTLAFAAAMMIAGQAHAADDDANRSDVRCILGMMALMRNPQTQAAGGAGTLYFTGRIDARDAQYDLQSALKREMQHMTPQDYAFEARRCGGDLKTRNEALKAIGEALKPKY